MDFREWLINKKKYSKRVSGDIVSRASRVKRMLNDNNIDSSAIEKIEKLHDYDILSYVVKCQLKKTIKLYLEFENDK